MFTDDDIDMFGPPNPALTAILNGNELRAILLREAQRGKSIFIGAVARGDDRRPGDVPLHQAAWAFTEKIVVGGTVRWGGVLEIRSDHILPHNFGWETERDTLVAAENTLNDVLALL